MAPSQSLMERAAGLVFVLALHAALLWGLWQHRLIPGPNEALTLFVNFIAPPVPEKKPEPPPPKLAKPKPVTQPAPRLVAATPVVASGDYVAPPPLPAPPPRSEAPAPLPAPHTPPAPLSPVTLMSELSVGCPERTAPGYPAIARRLGEEGTVVVRVELDESGAVTSAQIKTGSGHARLDEAALAAVRTWRCQPAQRGGQPVRAIALQPFKFVLQGN